MNEQQIAYAAARAAVAYRNGDDAAGDYWTERVQRLSDAAEAARRAPVQIPAKARPYVSGRAIRAAFYGQPADA